MSIGDKSVYADPTADTSEHSEHSVAYIVYIVLIPRGLKQSTDSSLIYQVYLGQLTITETFTHSEQLN